MKFKNIINLKQFNFKIYFWFSICLYAVSILLYQFSMLEQLELKSLDYRYIKRPKIEIHPDVGYISIDDKSTELVGPWRPWSRDKQVILVETLDYYKTKSAGYDVFFIEEEKVNLNLHKFKLFFDTLQSYSSEINFYDESIKRIIEKEITSSFNQNDLLFRNAIKKADNIFLGSYMLIYNNNSNQDLDETTQNIKNLFSDNKLKSIKITEKETLPIKKENINYFHNAYDIQSPISTLSEVSKGVGYAQIVDILDGIVRLYPVSIGYDNKAFFPISFLMTLDILNKDISEIEINYGKNVIIPNIKLIDSDDLTDIIIPVDNKMQTLANWTGKFDDTFLHIPYSLLSYYYAFIFGNGYLNNLPDIITNYNLIYNALYSNFIGSSLVVNDEAKIIASNLTISHLINKFIQTDTFNDDNISKLLKYTDETTLNLIVKNTLFSTAFKSEYKKHNKIPDLNNILNNNNLNIKSNYTSIYNYLVWYAKNNKLNDIKAYYFPEIKKVNHNGNWIDFYPYMLEDKIFLIGLTGTGTIDLNPMPFEESTPMVALHTTALNMLLTNQFLYFPPNLWKYVAPLLTVLLTVFFTYTITSSSIALIPLVLLAYSVFAVAFNYFWIVQNTWVHLVVPLLSIIISYLTIIIYQFILELKEKKKIRGIFSTMVSPTVLKLMEENPDKFSLTGERKEATMMFSLVKGFAKIMESSRPDELSSLLSIYLTPTSEIIMDYGGYIDKYEGHIIMADFGVPLDDTHHYWKCAYAGIEQILDITSFKYFVQARYGIDVSTLMGINFGYISAGNMGSEQKFQYTVMGDAVNVAARFMPANLIYNTNIITGGDTYSKIKDYTQLRHLDKLLLKGKTKPTDIYEVVGWNPKVYFDIFKDSNVPESLLTRWLKAPPEKIIGYQLFWKSKYNDTNNNMCKDIFDFFNNNKNDTLTRIETENQLEFLNYQIETLKLTEKISKITEKKFDISIFAIKNWEEKLIKWNSYIQSILNEFLNYTKNNKLVLETNEIDLINRLNVMSHKINLSYDKINFQKGIDEEIKIIFENLKTFIVNIDIADFDKIFNEAQINKLNYEKKTKIFYKNIVSKKREYFEMMSYVGSMNQNEIKLNEYYSKAMIEYWNRNWDTALNYFNEAKKFKPEDGPVNIMIDRTLSFKDNPPGSEWQGEFIQTKK